MTGSELHSTIKALDVTIPEFVKNFIKKKTIIDSDGNTKEVPEIPERTIFSHYAYKTRRLPSTAIKVYKDAIALAIASLYSQMANTKEIKERLKGPDNKLLGEMLSSIMRENQILMEDNSIMKKDIAYLLEEVKKLKSERNTIKV